MAEADKAVGPPAAVPTALPCLSIPTFSEACELVNSHYSYLVVETHRRHLTLSPKFLKRKRSGIQEQLNTELLKYSEGLNGVPFAYDNIKLLSELGDIYDDIGHIHVNIEADFVIFKPECEQKLVGIVNKIAPSHIGCLVHGCFNASIPKPANMPIENWQRIGINIDDRIEFQVFRLDSDAAGVFLIRGNLDEGMEAKAYETSVEENVEETVEVVEEGDCQEGERMSADVNVESVIETNGDIKEKSKKKSKQWKLQETITQDVESTVENSILDDTTMSNSGEVQEELPRKKLKRKKYKNIELNAEKADTEEIVDTSSFEENPFQESLAPLGEPIPKKSKKKKNKEIFHAPYLDSSVQNGIVEGTSCDPDVGEETLIETLARKKKKKHSYSEYDIDNNLEGSIVSEGQTAEGLVISQETPKSKKHKTKHQEHLLTGSDSSGFQSAVKLKKAKRNSKEDQEFVIIATEPKAKKKRVE